jgi:hypothetical protein
VYFFTLYFWADTPKIQNLAKSILILLFPKFG